MIWLGYFLTGSLAALIGALLGVSGGLITIPCLDYLFAFDKIPEIYRMHFVIGTSLSSMVFNGIASSYSFYKRNLVHWDFVKKTLLGILLGSVVGAVIARYLQTSFLREIFGVFLGLVALLLLRKKKQVNKTGSRSPLVLNLIGLSVGIGANILGIGGGIMLLPWLLHIGMEDKKALGTSATLSMFTTTIGAVLYLILGLNVVKDIPYSFGFIYLPAFLIIGLVSFLLAPLSVKLAARLPVKIIRPVIASLLVLVAIRMIIY